MTIVDLVQTVADTLTPSERRLVKEVISAPREIALGTAGELAAKIGVHEATASRLARKLGFGSYAEFRDAIRDEFLVRNEPAARIRKTLDSLHGSSILQTLVAQEIDALTTLLGFVDQDKIDEAARALAGRRKIFIFARGNAETLAVLMYRRLRRMAIDVVILDGDNRDLAEKLLSMGPDDALIAFAFRRQPRQYPPLIERARSVGAWSVVISEAIGPALTPAADQLLSAPRCGPEEGFQTLTVPMAICNALILSLAQASAGRSLPQLQELGELIGEFEAI